VLARGVHSHSNERCMSVLNQLAALAPLRKCFAEVYTHTLESWPVNPGSMLCIAQSFRHAKIIDAVHCNVLVL
jgi:hypothetical protein